ncbi:hypothetical protein GCM10007416_18270 [Kroppenstedtia guangzhouensis]|uniref:Peptidase S8/S53 domain-containing protein n=1 Tax=Kroppenstedtia guangzhouensis TaxID=1274356 RepID=A0ABQ1GKT3_9BACL|nr:S8 family serine peptidase [Kroppenstedtia guangzhouensis]GGA45480.1 hypothetical protein GCM10007416_18270 [Kroppenstedtia guangzhouensis]
MNRTGWLAAVGILFLLLVTGCTEPDGRDGPDPAPGNQETGKETVQKEWVIKWKENQVDPAFLRTVDVLHRRENGGGINMLVRLKGGVKEEEWLDHWSSHVNVEFIHPNQKYKVEKQEEHRAGDQDRGMYYIRQIRADEAWRKVPLKFKKTESNRPVTVAVVDTGVDLDHPALVPYLVEGVNLKDPSLPPEDNMGHGTHVAGVVAEVWKGWEGKGELTGLHLMPVKVMSDGSDGDVYYTSEGIREAVRRGARVIVLAQGSWTYSEAMADAVAYAEESGSVVVGAAGNASVNPEGEILYNSPIYYPAAFPTVIGVGSVGPAGKVVPTSNWGPGIDVVAPGEGIRAAILEGKFGRDSGTSFATPQVGALAALILRKDPNQTPGQVRNLIRQTAQPQKGHRWNQQYGYGLIDVHAALTQKPLEDIHESNDREEEAAPFSINQVVQGVLEGSEDRDCFEVEVSHNGMLTLTFKGDGKIPRVTAQITAAGKKRVQYEGEQAEQIRVTVPHGSVIACYSTSRDRSWEYTLENQYRPLPDEYENNDHQWNAFNIKVKPGYSVFRGTLHKRRDYDWYRLDIPEEGSLTLRVDLWSPRGDPVLFIQREGSWKGKKVDQGAEGKVEEYRMKVKQESVYVRVSDYGTNFIDNPYNLMVRFESKNRDAQETHHTSSRAAPLQPGVTTEGRLDGEADQDWYILFLPQTEKSPIQIRIPRGAEETTLWLYDESLQVLDEKHLSKGGKQGELNLELAPGTYYLRVRGGSADAGKSYQLKVKPGPS